MKVSSTDVKDLHYQYQKEKAEEKAEPGNQHCCTYKRIWQGFSAMRVFLAQNIHDLQYGAFTMWHL